jgi:hypothetical protein
MIVGGSTCHKSRMVRAVAVWNNGRSQARASERVPRRMSDQDVERPTPAAPDPYSETAHLAWFALHRYAGWLGRDVSSKRVRAAVDALGLVLAQREGPDTMATAIATLTSEVEQLSAFALRPLFRKALQDLRSGLDAPKGGP